MYLKYPINKGEGWIDNHSDYSEKFDCVSTNDTVLINDNTYVCFKIRQGWWEDEDPSFLDSYYSKGLGFIQSVNYENVYDWIRITKQVLVNAQIK
jgi:hypothetical protein